MPPVSAAPLPRLAQEAAAAARLEHGKLQMAGRLERMAPSIPAPGTGPSARRLMTSSSTPGGSGCGCHVHVGVPSRDLGVQVLARLRPWLASLLAITVNSPIAGGRDTAWASSRYLAWSRWPTAAPPAVWPDAAAYDAAVRGLIGRGAAVDERGIYLLARLSPRYPTVEVRVADACLDAGTAVLLAGLSRRTTMRSSRRPARTLPAAS